MGDRTPPRSYLTDRFFALFGAAALFGTMAMALPLALPLYAAALAGALALAAFDRLSLTTSASFEAKLSFPRDPSLGRPTRMGIEIRPRDRGASALSRLDVFAPETPLLAFAAPRTRVGAARLSEERIVLELTCEVERLGYHVVDRLEVGTYSKLGLWFRPLTLKTEPIGFRVAPESRKMPERAFSEMIATQRLLFEGARIRARARAADQYLTTRAYQYPDPVRHLDHKKSARTGRLMTRVFESSFQHHLVIALDLGRSMMGRVGGSSKHDYYLSAGLLLARNAVHSRDRVSFFAFSDELHALVPRSRTLAPFEAMLKGSATFAPREAESDFHLINETVPRVSGQRAIVLVLADLSRPSVQDSLLESLGPLCREHVVVALSLAEKGMRLDDKILAFRPSQLGATFDSFRDAYADFLYDYWADERFRLFRARLTGLGGAALQIPHENWMSAVDGLYRLLRRSTRA